MRIGVGYDIHPLVPGRKLFLGGIAIPFEAGLDGWSDGDVLTHAITDALLGAAALGDIGSHFPAGDERHHNIASVSLLSRVAAELFDSNWTIVNIDATIVADEPRLSPYILGMRESLAYTLVIPMARVSIKAHSTNGLGLSAVGRGVAAYAVCLIDSAARNKIPLEPWV